MKALTAGITWTFMTSDAKFEEEIEDGYRQKCVMVSGTFSKPELER
jgi:hypothetical protein